MNPSPELAAAIRQQRAGNLAAAGEAYRQILLRNPDDADAWNFLGIALFQTGQKEKAVEAMRRAVSLRPRHESYLTNLAKALHAMDDLEGAEQACREALRLNPDSPQANNNLGGLLIQKDRFQESEALLLRAARLKPDYAEAFLNLGRLRVRQKDWAAAQQTLERALDLAPGDSDARVGLGIAFFGLKRFEKALLQFDLAESSRPGDLRLHYYRGLVQLRLRRHEEAKRSFECVLRIDPKHALGHFGLAYALIRLRRLEEAEPCLRASVELDPKNPLSLTELGMIENQKGNYAEGRKLLRSALEIDPHCAGAHFNLAIDHLLHGDFAQGWKEFLWIRQIEDLSPPHLAGPCWDGRADPDGVILLRAEQGFGDMIQLARYAPLVKKRVGRVVLECPKTLRRVLSNAPGVDEVLELGEKVPEGIHSIPLFNLPALFGTTEKTIPWNGPYASGNFPMRPILREFFPQTKNFKVGIVWQGNPEHPDDLRRSMPAESFAHLAGIEGIKLYSLQKGFGIEQLKPLQERLPVQEIGSLFEDFADTAVALRELDLVIGVDTSVIHLAGAMGKPAWALLSFVPEWRWMLDRDESPWYPSLRLFRQRSPGDWKGVMERVAQELRELVATRG